MNIQLSADALEVLVMSSGTTVLPPKKEFGSDKQKRDRNGNPIYDGRTLQVLRRDNQGQPCGIDQSVSVNLLEPAKVEFGRIYRLAGDLNIVHWSNKNGFVNATITATSLTPLTPTKEEESLPDLEEV